MRASVGITDEAGSSTISKKSGSSSAPPTPGYTLSLLPSHSDRSCALGHLNWPQHCLWQI